MMDSGAVALSNSAAVSTASTSNDSAQFSTGANGVGEIGVGHLGESSDRPVGSAAREVLSNGPPNVTVFSRFSADVDLRDQFEFADDALDAVQEVRLHFHLFILGLISVVMDK